MKRTLRGRKIDPSLKELAFSLFCFALSQSEIAAKIKVTEACISTWCKQERWYDKRKIVLREHADAKGREMEGERNALRQHEADLSRKCWAHAQLALSRLDLRHPKTQDIKNLAELASLLGRRALNMPLHDAMELTVNHQFGDEIDAALKRVLARRQEKKAIELSAVSA